MATFTMTAANCLTVANNESGSTNEVHNDDDLYQLQNVFHPTGAPTTFGGYAASGQASQPEDASPGLAATEQTGTQQPDLPQGLGDASDIEQQMEVLSSVGGAVQTTHLLPPMSMTPHGDVQQAVDQFPHPMSEQGLSGLGHSAGPNVFGDQEFESPNGRCCWNCYEGELLLSYNEYKLLLDKAKQLKFTVEDIDVLRDRLFHLEAVLEEKDQEIDRMYKVDSRYDEDWRQRIADANTKFALEKTEHENLIKVHEALRVEFRSLERSHVHLQKESQLEADRVRREVDESWRVHEDN